jgi:pimeloyl-ACP methyl ester carboxylesterase
MLCDAELYAAQVAALADIVEPRVLTAAAPRLGEAAAAVLAEAPPRFLLAGTSYGGNLALEILAAAPERVAGLAVIAANPGPHSNPLQGRQLQERVVAGDFAAVVDELAERMIAPKNLNAAHAADIFRRMAERAGPERFLTQHASLLDRMDRLPALAAARCPVLLLWGWEDRLTSPSLGSQVAARVPAARFYAIVDCGHLPTLEKPTEATAELRAWIERCLADVRRNA